MNEFLIGYARVSTNEQDLTAQQNALERLGTAELAELNVARSTIYRTIQRQHRTNG